MPPKVPPSYQDVGEYSGTALDKTLAQKALKVKVSVRFWIFLESKMERVKGFEPSTPTLARLCSTPELHSHVQG